MNRSISLLFAVLAVACSRPLFAASSSAQMHVSVEVVARTMMNVSRQPASVEITPADVARGYVEVPAAITFEIRSNARNGYVMQFQPVSEPFREARITWGTTTAKVGSEESWIAQPYQKGTAVGSMNVRLVLAPTAAPGTYSWPISIDANSL